MHGYKFIFETFLIESKSRLTVIPESNHLTSPAIISTNHFAFLYHESKNLIRGASSSDGGSGGSGEKNKGLQILPHHTQATRRPTNLLLLHNSVTSRVRLV